MKSIEEDAKQRAEDRKKRKEKAEELKTQAELQFNSGDYREALETYDRVGREGWSALANLDVTTNAYICM